jgi:hypothetical protein
MDRLAVFTFATTLAVGACSGEVDDPGAGNGDGGGRNDAGQVADASRDAVNEDTGTLQAAYGAPPPDGSVDIDAGPPDDGGVQAAYGLPPDAVAPPYGLPPTDSGTD